MAAERRRGIHSAMAGGVKVSESQHLAGGVLITDAFAIRTQNLS